MMQLRNNFNNFKCFSSRKVSSARLVEHLSNVGLGPQLLGKSGVYQNSVNSSQTQRAISVLRETLTAHPDVMRQGSIRNYVWLGVYAVPFLVTDDLVGRMYIVPPNNWEAEKHCAVCKTNYDDFFYHDHSYNFVSHTLCGMQTNQRYAVTASGPHNEWWKYKYTPALTPSVSTWRTHVNEPAKVEPIGRVHLNAFAEEDIQAGDSYAMQHDEIHSVWFYPDTKNKWFACLFWESARAKAPSPTKLAYSPAYFDKLPLAAEKHQTMQAGEVDALVGDFFTALGGGH
jgi:hypothetical protein